MRFPSGDTDQYIYFVAVDSTDLKTRETGLTSFTVYRSRNGGAAAAYTTPTINETDSTNMPGVYELLLDEDMTIDSGDDSQAVVLHITQASMAPVTLTYELYRPKVTAGETLTAASGVGSANAVQISGDSAAADNLENAFDDTAGPVPWLGIIDQGTAQSASSTGLVLRAAAAFADDTLIGATLAAYGSTQGYWQTRTITDCALSGDSVTVDAWTVTPSGTITYKIFAGPPASATALPAVNVTQVGGSTTDVAALATNVAAILVDTGTTLDGKINTIDTVVDSILVDTAEIGAAGAGLTALATAANLATVDTVVDAIKAKTDSLTFTVAGVVDANIQRINDVAVTGDGQPGTEFNV